LAIACEGEPVRVTICHCLTCQRRTGSVFSAQARYLDDNVHIEGRSTEYLRVGESGGEARFYFCPDCGSTVYYRVKQTPGVTAIPVGAFADPSFPAPTRSVYEARKHGWVAVPEGTEHIA
jgi:hypothetical protein